MNNYVIFSVRAALISALLLSVPATTSADLKILTVGDSLTSGKDGIRGTYRPHLEQQIDFFLNTPGNNPNGIAVDFVGAFTGPNDVIGGGGTNPMPVNGVVDFSTGMFTNTITNWDSDHQGQSGASTFSFDRRASVLPAADVALVWLGTNDLAINIDANTSSPFTFNKSDPLDKYGYGSVSTAVALFTGDPGHPNADKKVGTVEAMLNAGMQVLVGAIPPIDVRANGTERSYYWTEAAVAADPFDVNSTGHGTNVIHRRPNPINSSSPTQDVNGDGDLLDDVNDIIDEINAELEALALATPGVTFVDLLSDTTMLTDNAGNAIALSPFDTDLTDDGGESDHLIDGLHTNTLGDQTVAGNWFEEGLRSIVATQSGASATAVPEPSGFLFLGLLTTLFGVISYKRRAS